MQREDLGDLAAFLAVLEEGSFTRAAAKLATSQSALSHTVQRLEARLGLRLLNRTTRRVAATEAGEKLAATLRPCLDQIDSQIAALSALRDRPAGLVRLTTSAHAAETVVWPAISRLLPDYPDLQVELNVESRFTDIVAERFDAGVRLGESVDRDMIAVRIGPDMRMALVASPAYLARHPAPTHPQDLLAHACINLRLPTLGGLYAWEFAKQGRALNVRVQGPLVFNTPALCLAAAAAGHGLAFLPDGIADPLLASGQLVRLMPDWCQPFAGYHLYYPSRRQLSPALRLIIDHLRHAA